MAWQQLELGLRKQARSRYVHGGSSSGLTIGSREQTVWCLLRLSPMQDVITVSELEEKAERAVVMLSRPAICSTGFHRHLAFGRVGSISAVLQSDIFSYEVEHYVI